MIGELHALEIEGESLQADLTEQDTHRPGHTSVTRPAPGAVPECPIAQGQLGPPSKQP